MTAPGGTVYDRSMTLVVVGAGLAGAKAVEAAREAGYDGKVVLVGEEESAPYERPPLSKQVFRGEKPPESARVHDEGFYDEHHVELRTGDRVTELDLTDRTVHVGDEVLPYDRLVLAMGARPRRLDVPGADLPGTHYLRTVEDSARLAEAVRGAGRVAVIGGGWIGSEVAASARQLGADVVMIDPTPTPLHGVLGAEIGASFAQLHRDHGVALRMPQLFLALATEEAAPVSRVIAATPEAPAGCAWSTFVRNHDELSLEAVTDDERSLLYAAYCPEERMRANVGIRRRLAPLVGHSDDAQLLLTSLLLSLPGTPILYYGDEIGMGDNIWLEDRDAVRTPMQWSAEGGFSSASDTYYPVNASPVHGPSAVNVDDQLVLDGSLLRRTREALAARRRHPAMATGRYVELATGSASVLAFLRVQGDDVVLCVNSFSAAPQQVTVELGEWGVLTPMAADGRVLELDGDARLTLPLEPHGVRWLALAPAVPHQAEGSEHLRTPVT